MGGGASKEEKLDGTAVTGRWGKRVEMPPGVVAEQMKGGPYPGKKFLAFTPRLLQELNAKKGATTLYLEFEKVVSEECGGGNLKGWDSKKIHEVVSRFQPQFNEKGISVQYCMVKWYVHHGTSGHMEFRYWLTFTDMEAVPKGVAVDLYDPKTDYDKMDKDEEKLFKAEDPFVVVGTPVNGKFASFDPTGRWVADMETATGVVKKWIKKMEYTTTKTGSVYESVTTYQLSMMCFGVKGTARSTTQPIPNEQGAFMSVSSDGEYSRITINSPDSVTATDVNGKWAVTFIRGE